MKVLLTGGTGYIGSHTAVVLAQAGHEVVLYDNFSNSSPKVAQCIESITGNKMPLIEGDIRDTALLQKTLKTHHVEAVVHFAGLKAVGESALKPVDYYANNVQGTVSLLQAMQAVNISRLVFSSSATVYGEPHYLPIDESHATSATNAYGRTKLHIEEMLRDVAASRSAWRIASLRYFNPVGAHESGLIGEDPLGTPNNLMPYIAQVASGKLPYLNVFGNDYGTKDGTGVRDYIHVMDLAEGHVAALRFLNKESGWHAFNLGTGNGQSVLEMLAAFEQASGRRIAYKVVARRSGDVAACYAQVDKAREILGWQATRTLQQMCESTWHWQAQETPALID